MHILLRIAGNPLPIIIFIKYIHYSICSFNFHFCQLKIKFSLDNKKKSYIIKNKIYIIYTAKIYSILTYNTNAITTEANKLRLDEN